MSMSEQTGQTTENKVVKLVMVIMVFAAIGSVMICLMGGIPVDFADLGGGAP